MSGRLPPAPWTLDRLTTGATGSPVWQIRDAGGQLIVELPAPNPVALQYHPSGWWRQYHADTYLLASMLVRVPELLALAAESDEVL